MTDTHDSSKDTPAVGTNDGAGTDAERAHRRMERDAMKGAKRGEERLKKDEAGKDLVSNL